MATKVIKEIITDVGGNTTIEYSDDTTQKYNVADVVTAQSNPVTGGISLSAGARAFTTGRNPGNGAYTFGELLPKHRMALDGDRFDPTTTACPAGFVASTVAASSGEFCSSSLQIAVTGAQALQLVRIPIPQTTYNEKVVVGAVIHIRINVSDWSKITQMNLLCDETYPSNRYELPIVIAGKTQFGATDPAFSAKWNGVYRTVVLFAQQRDTSGSPPSWASGPSSSEYLSIDGFRLRVQTTGSVNISINRIYSPKWPVGVLVVNGDGGYDSFRNVLIPAFAERGWRGGVSLYRNNVAGTIYPSAADLDYCANAGFDVLPHSHNASTISAFSGTETKAQVESEYQAILQRVQKSTAKQPGLRYSIFLQDSGKSNVAGGLYMAQILEKFGVVGGRGDCVDGNYGCNPFNATYTTRVSPKPLTVDNVTQASQSVGFLTGWVFERGPHNAVNSTFYENDAIYWPNTPLNHDTYTGSVCNMLVSRAAAFSSVTFQYTHQIVPYDGTEPSQYNSGTNQFSQMLAHLDSLVASGSLLVLSPSELFSLTYARQGDVYLRPDGEWSYRNAPTTIAF